MRILFPQKYFFLESSSVFILFQVSKVFEVLKLISSVVVPVIFWISARKNMKNHIITDQLYLVTFYLCWKLLSVP